METFSKLKKVLYLLKQLHKYQAPPHMIKEDMALENIQIILKQIRVMNASSQAALQEIEMDPHNVHATRGSFHLELMARVVGPPPSKSNQNSFIDCECWTR